MFLGESFVSALTIEKKVRDEFNKLLGIKAKKDKLSFSKSGPIHEFDMYEQGKVIGGVSTSPWFNKPNKDGKISNNTAGQDRAATEILWLSLWSGPERRVHILTDSQMAARIYKKFKGAVFPKNVEIHHFNIDTNIFTHIGTL
jgi:hypothetical protein